MDREPVRWDMDIAPLLVTWGNGRNVDALAADDDKPSVTPSTLPFDLAEMGRAECATAPEWLPSDATRAA